MGNEQLKQEVAHLTEDLIQVKGKTEQTQPHQDNTIKEIKKLYKEQLWFASCAIRKTATSMSARRRTDENRH
jgi:hypothetical protein